MTEEQRNAAVPAAALLLREFVNTYEPQVDQELIGTPELLGAWLTDHGLLTGADRLTSSDQSEMVALREGLRSVLQANAGHGVDADRVAALNDRLRSVLLRAEIDGHGMRLVAVDPRPFSRALGLLLDAIRRSQTDGSWRRLKVCDRESCRWAYYDTSRNQVRRWCSMAGCGNYVKMRRRAERSRT